MAGKREKPEEIVSKLRQVEVPQGHARLLEIDPAYVDVMLRRWRDETGEDLVRVADGVSLSVLEAKDERHA